MGNRRGKLPRAGIFASFEPLLRDGSFSESIDRDK